MPISRLRDRVSLRYSVGMVTDPSLGLHLSPVIMNEMTLGLRGTALAGGVLRFSEIAVEAEGSPPRLLPTAAVAALHPGAAVTLARLSRPRPPLGRLALDTPHALGVAAVAEPGGVAAAVALMLGAGADAVELSLPPDAAGPDWLRAMSAAARATALVIGGAPSALAAAAGAAGWRAPDWAAVAEGDTAGGRLIVTPRPPAPLADAADVRRVHDGLERNLAAAEARGVARASLVVDLGCVLPPAMAAVGLLHGLGCALMAEPAAPGRPVADFAAAAACVLAAGRGVQLLRSDAAGLAPVAAGLSVWRAAQVAGAAGDGSQGAVA